MDRSRLQIDCVGTPQPADDAPARIVQRSRSCVAPHMQVPGWHRNRVVEDCGAMAERRRTQRERGAGGPADPRSAGRRDHIHVHRRGGLDRLAAGIGSGYADLLAAHNRIIRRAVSTTPAVEVRTEGDSFFCVFTACLERAGRVPRRTACTSAHGGRRLGDESAHGLHTGEAESVDGDYIGLAVHQAARVVDAGHGGQVLRLRGDAVGGRRTDCPRALAAGGWAPTG